MKNNEPITFDLTGQSEVKLIKRPYQDYGGTPVHSECSNTLHTSSVEISTTMYAEKHTVSLLYINHH